jgi:hypothetical protein
MLLMIMMMVVWFATVKLITAVMAAARRAHPEVNPLRVRISWTHRKSFGHRPLHAGCHCILAVWQTETSAESIDCEMGKQGTHRALNAAVLPVFRDLWLLFV